MESHRECLQIRLVEVGSVVLENTACFGNCLGKKRLSCHKLRVGRKGALDGYYMTVEEPAEGRRRSQAKNPLDSDGNYTCIEQAMNAGQ